MSFENNLECSPMRGNVRQKKEEQNHKLLDPDNFWSQTILDALGALFQNIRQCVAIFQNNAFRKNFLPSQNWKYWKECEMKKTNKIFFLK